MDALVRTSQTICKQFTSSISLSALEHVSPSKRSISGPLTMGLGNALAGMSEPWVLKYLVDWKIFHQILFSIPLIALVTPL